MKKFLVIITLIIFLVGCACSVKGGAKESLYIFLEKYKYLDKSLVEDVDSYVLGESLSEEQKEKYKEIILRQYKDMDYEIVKEEYKNKKAYITVKVTVYDLFEAQNETEDYYIEHEDEFLKDGEYDADKYINDKLEFMKNYTKKVTNEITFVLHEDKNMWVVEQPSSSDLAKIHGMYQ